MMTKDEIKQKLQENSDFTLPEGASDKEWDLFDEVWEELFGEDDIEDTYSLEAEDEDEGEDET